MKYFYLSEEQINKLDNSFQLYENYTRTLFDTFFDKIKIHDKKIIFNDMISQNVSSNLNNRTNPDNMICIRYDYNDILKCLIEGKIKYKELKRLVIDFFNLTTFNY